LNEVQSGSAFHLVPPHRNYLPLSYDHMIPGVIVVRPVYRPLVNGTLYDAIDALVAA